MLKLTSSQIVFIARQHYDSGRLLEAEGLCRKVLADEASMPGALHLMGLTLWRSGQCERAAVFLSRAVEVQPGDAGWHRDLAAVQRQAGQLDDAAAAYRRVIDLDPSDHSILLQLARVLHDAGRIAAAIAVWQEAIVRQSESTDNHIGLAESLQDAGRFEEAVRAYQRALQIDPRKPDAWHQLGLACQHSGDLPSAIKAFQRAIALDPQSVDAYIRLGNALTESGDIDAAASAYAHARLLQPDNSQIFSPIGSAKDPERFAAAMNRCWEICAERAGDADTYFKLGLTVQLHGNADAAIAAYRKVLALSPGHIKARNNLGSALRDTGNFDEAFACFRQAADADPPQITCHSNLLYLMHFAPRHDPAALLAEHRAWSRRYAEPLKILHRPHENSPQPGRRLRIGYVSPNFHEHPVGRFLRQLYDFHDHEQFEIVSYSSVRKADALTERFREKSDRWVRTLGMRDDALADRVRADGIDILIDLTMHMRDQRLLAFARRPAPVQLTYLAYCSTTGLDTIDYRLTDPFLDPPGVTDSYYSEKSVRLPRTYWCYHPGISTPDVNPLPALSNRYVTFASFNNFCKVSPQTLELWIRLMQAIPASRLLLHTYRGSHRQRLVDRFAEGGITADRLQFADLLSLGAYFAQYLSVDIALDTFPYPGGTTTCDALWMGVPTVSLVGSAGYTRGGLSILCNVELAELATFSPEQYLQAAIELASDLPRLAALRTALRDRLRSSPLMNGCRFAVDIEAVYRSLWGQWCVRQA